MNELLDQLKQARAAVAYLEKQIIDAQPFKVGDVVRVDNDTSAKWKIENIIINDNDVYYRCRIINRKGLLGTSIDVRTIDQLELVSDEQDV